MKNNNTVMELISAKTELEQYFNVYLSTEDKLKVLEVVRIDIDNHLQRITNRKQRIPALAKKQVLEECIDILEKYYAVERTKEK